MHAECQDSSTYSVSTAAPVTCLQNEMVASGPKCLELLEPVISQASIILQQRMDVHQ
jgi:hypothetical protein